MPFRDCSLLKAKREETGTRCHTHVKQLEEADICGLFVIRGTTEHGTAERRNEKQRNGIFFSVFFFFFNKKKQQQRKSKYISQNKGHAYILYPSKSI